MGAAPKPGAEGPGLAERAAMFPPPALTSVPACKAAPSLPRLRCKVSFPPTSWSAAALARAAAPTPHAPPHSSHCRARPRKALFKGRGRAASDLRNDVISDAAGGVRVLFTAILRVLRLETVRLGLLGYARGRG